MPFRKPFLTTLLLFVCLIATAQRQLFNIYTIQDGLVDNRIRKIFQDEKGFIWVGTWEGISRYDGHTFTNFSTTNGLSHDLVNDLIEKDNRLYILLNDGSVDILQHNRIQQLHRFSSPLNKFAALPDGRIIIPSDENGFYELSNGTITKPNQKTPYYNCQLLLPYNDSLIIAVESNIYVSVLTTQFSELVRIQDWNQTEGINFIFKDRQQRIWLCTNKGLRLLQFNQTTRELKILMPSSDLVPSTLLHTPVTTIEETADGFFWTGCSTGLARWKSPNDLLMYTKEDGLPPAAITSIYNDTENNLWLGTNNGLAKFVRQKEIDQLNRSIGLLPGEVLSIADLKDGKLMLSTYSGPRIYDPVTETVKAIPAPTHKTALIYHENTYPWIFTNNEGIYQFDEKKNMIIPLIREPIFMSSTAVTDRDGNGFIGLDANIGILSRGKIFMKKLPVAERITAMTTDKSGQLWVGTWKKGLYRVEYQIKDTGVMLTTTNYSQLVPDSAIRSLFSGKDGSIWVGTRYKGAYRLQLKNGNYTATAVYDKKTGLSSNFITTFAETENNDIWIGSPYGLDKLIKKNDRYDVFNFSTINNLLGTVYQIKKAGKNSWWVVIEQNLVRLTDHFLENKGNTKPVITRIRLGSSGQPIDADQQEEQIRLPYAQNQAQFEFAAPSFINESQILYSYRLLGGTDSSWSEPRNIHEVFYASLQPGRYTFQVRTLGWNKQFSEPAIYRFRVLPPFWQTWWFILLCLLLLFTFFYLLYRYRVRRIMEVQNVRNRIATDLHDDIGSTLTNISILTELSQKNLHQHPQQSAQYLERIAEEINDSGQALDDIIWNINHKNDTLEEMIVRMRRYAAELFDHTSATYQLMLQPGAAAVKTGMEQRRDIYMVFKESLNNIHKHAAAQHIEIDLKSTGNTITLLIKDDGKGFDTTINTHRNGLKNMKSRVEKWGGTITIESANGKGTRIEVKMKIS